MANNRVCLTCGKAYEYCGYCPTSKNLPMWMNLFDTENCKNVFETVSEETAATNLSLCDLSQVSVYKENIQKLVSEIIDDKNDKKVTATKKREQAVKIVPKSKVNKNSVD